MENEAPVHLSSNVSLRGRDDADSVNKQSQIYKRSLSMAEAMLHPQRMQQPIPIALRVKNAGREFLKHDQTCQWIQFIQDHDPEPPKRTQESYSGTPISTKCNFNNTQEKVINQPASQQGLSQLSPVEASFYEEQLKSLQKQQEELLLRQHQLEDQLEQQKRAQDVRSLEQLQRQAEESESFVVQESKLSHLVQNESLLDQQPPKFRRRLKGSVAQSYAQRSEGCLEGLLYYMDRPDCPEKKPVNEQSFCKSVSGDIPLESVCSKAPSPARPFSNVPPLGGVREVPGNWTNYDRPATARYNRGEDVEIWTKERTFPIDSSSSSFNSQRRTTNFL